MWRVALRSILGRWPRLVMTALAIVASTAFLSGTFIYRDTVQRSFDDVVVDVYKRVDVVVRSERTVGANFASRRARVDASVVPRVAAVPSWRSRCCRLRRWCRPCSPRCSVPSCRRSCCRNRHRQRRRALH